MTTLADMVLLILKQWNLGSEQSRCMEHNNFLEIGNIHILDFHCISPAQ